MKVHAIEIQNVNHGQFCGQAIPHGTLCVEVDSIPKLVYRKIGEYYISTTAGIVDYYKHVPGSTGGFGDRKITLMVKGQGVVFKNKGITRMTFRGDLWDAGKQEVEDILGYNIYRIGLRTGLSGPYFSFNVTRDWIDRIGQFVITGSPQQPIYKTGLALEIK